jgi:hypothetical protein
VRAIYFGSSASSKNGILGAVNADLTSMASSYAANGIAIKQKAQGMVDSLLAKVGSGSTSTSMSKSSAIISIDGPLGSGIEVNNADVSFKPSSVIAASLGNTVKLPFAVEINVPYISLGTDFDDLRFVDLSIAGLSIKGTGSQGLALNNLISINDVEALADRVSAIARQLLSEQPIVGNINAGRIVIGASSTDNIDAISKVYAGISIDKLAGALKGTDSSSSFNMDSIKNLAKKFGVKANNFGLAAQPARILQATASVGFTNPLPVSLTGLGFFAVSGGIDDADIVNVNIPGLSVIRGGNKLDLAINMEFPSSGLIRGKVASFGRSVTDHFGQTSEYFSASGVKFGMSSNDYIHFLEKTRLGFSSSKILNQKTLDALLGSNATTIDPSSLADMVSLKSASVEFHSTNVIDASLAANLTMPYEVTLSIPFFQAGSLVDEVPFCYLSLNGLKISGKGASELALASALEVHDSDSLATKIANIAAAFAKKKPFPGTIGGGSLSLGIDNSPQNVIDTFSKIWMSVPLDPLAQSLLKRNSTDFDPTPYIDGLNLQLGDVSVQTIPGRIVKSSIAADLTNRFKISIKGLGYMSATTGIDGNTLVSLTANGISLQPGNNSLKIGAELYFPSSAEIQNSVAAFADHVMDKGVGNTPELITATGIAFGFDSDHHFRFLRSAMLGISSSTILNKKTVEYVKGKLGITANSTIDPLALMKRIDLQKLHVDGSRGLIVDAGVSLKNASFSAQANIGYVALGALVNREEYNSTNVGF